MPPQLRTRARQETKSTRNNKKTETEIKRVTKKPCETLKVTNLTPKQENNGILTVDTPSPFKTPQKSLDSSLILNRPKRICRLPSRFEDYSISPSKFIPVVPCHASTPIVHSKPKVSEGIQHGMKSRNIKKISKTNGNFSKKVLNASTDTQSTDNTSNSLKITRKVTQKALDRFLGEKVSPDTNNNRKQTRSVRNKNLITQKNPSIVSSKIGRNNVKILIDKSNSLKVVDEVKDKNIDVYEFTYDPNEDPTPQKKKRKRVVKKKPTQPKKQFLYTNNYDKNVSKTLAALKTVVSKNTVKSQKGKVVDKPIQRNDVPKVVQSIQNSVKHTNENINKVVENTKGITELSKPSATGAVNSSTIAGNCSPIYEAYIDFKIGADNSPAIVGNCSPIYEDDIDFKCGAVNSAAIAGNCSPIYENDVDINCINNDLNYSPILTVDNLKKDNLKQSETQTQLHKDPLNLLDDLSFFDEQPVACSSVNMSTKHPLASPWRVEFESLPIKWQVNSYVKPNMTPAVECSFINSEDNFKKKHVYTNMIALNNDTLPQIVDNEPSYKQTSIISFIKEVAEKQAKKKLHKSPKKVNSLFKDITNTANYDIHTSKEFGKNTSDDRDSINKNTSNRSSNLSNDKENSKENKKRKNNEDINPMPGKSPKRQNDRDYTYFGFDDTEEQDENISPVQNTKKCNPRSLGLRSRNVNVQNGPTRPRLPLAAKSNVILSSEAVNKVYEDMKSATDAPIFKEQNVDNIVTTNIDKSQVVVNDNDDSQSVHLFEDINVVHHLKPTRKSYGKAKKVAFKPQATSDSDTEPDNPAEVEEGSSDDDDLADLTFHIPNAKEKKPKTKKKISKKKLISKKEQKEVEAWAASFNSMCEDIEEFPLLVE